MNLEVQTAALVIAGAAAGLTAVAARMTAWHSRRRAVGEVGTPASEPYILYFTTPDCSTCRLQQEPALSQLEGETRIEKVDAVERRDLAEKYAVFTVPTTVVVAPDGRALAVNYGFAPAAKLRRQLAAVGKAAA